MVITGETDLRKSNYVNSDGEVCGNPCLAQDRANSVLEKLEIAHPENNSTNSLNHKGTLNQNDRKSSVMFFPKSVNLN